MQDGSIHSTAPPPHASSSCHPKRVVNRSRFEDTCLFQSLACPTRFWLPLRRQVTPPPPRSRNKRFRTYSLAVTCLASRRPAPAKPPPSLCPCSPCLSMAAPAPV